MKQYNKKFEVKHVKEFVTNDIFPNLSLPKIIPPLHQKQGDDKQVFIVVINTRNINLKLKFAIMPIR